jgi:DNA-binding FadR family transcriptional regulator
VQVNDRPPSEAELSRRSGVSRPIVCEALGRLQALGLTEAWAGRGTFVASSVTKLTITFGQYSASDLNEVPSVRRGTGRPPGGAAPDVGGHSVPRVDPRGARAGCRSGGGRRDRHRVRCTIAQATGNKLFVRLVQDLREIHQEQSLAVSTLRDRGAQVAREHRRVPDAIIAEDGEAAPSAMSDHLDAVERAILSGPAQAAEQRRV